MKVLTPWSSSTVSAKGMISLADHVAVAIIRTMMLGWEYVLKADVGVMTDEIELNEHDE